MTFLRLTITPRLIGLRGIVSDNRFPPQVAFGASIFDITRRRAISGRSERGRALIVRSPQFHPSFELSGGRISALRLRAQWSRADLLDACERLPRLALHRHSQRHRLPARADHRLSFATRICLARWPISRAASLFGA